MKKIYNFFSRIFLELYMGKNLVFFFMEFFLIYTRKIYKGLNENL